ncbi:MAG: ABC transporter ATP-binding protein [Nitrososphaerales archaeon]
MSEALVKTVELERRYKRGKFPVPALNGVNLTVEKGEILGIIGPSGSGKTTLLNLIGGLDRPSKGTVHVDGVELDKLNDAELTEYRLHKVGFVFQFYNLIPTLSAVENVELPMALAKVPVAEQRQRALNLLEAVGLEARSDHMPDELSGGEQQRVAVARALANHPSVVLADEPTGDLDSKSAKKLMEVLKLLRKEEHATFVLVTHDPIVVAECNRVCAIRDGKITRESRIGEDGKILDHSRFVMDALF